MGQNSKLALTPPPLMNNIKEDFPEITAATRIKQCPKVVVKSGEKIFNESNGIFADPDFFNMFSFNLKGGDYKSYVDQPASIILTQKMAKKYFGDTNPLNKTIFVKGYPLTISGIIEDVPNNSHFQFDFVIPINLLTHMGVDLTDWGNVDLYTYIETTSQVDFNNLNQKMMKWDTPREEFFFIQPLTNIHFNTNMIADNAFVTNKKHIYVFMIIAFFILLVAVINYLVLYISTTLKRSKEIGVRKINGSGRKRLIFQFLTESSIQFFISFVIAIFIVLLFFPRINALTGMPLTIQFF
ncbi:MAG: FtsX-like permease family protein [Bacteroidales bacterium]|nr:FtsX-like permease family protein [Bacteroidales bacterium]